MYELKYQRAINSLRHSICQQNYEVMPNVMASGSDEDGHCSPLSPVDSFISDDPQTPKLYDNEDEEDRRSSQGALKRKLKAKEDKNCLVCGDKALGCNFGATSCESCKAFFRRNALRDKNTKCLFEGKCKIDLNTRRFCSHCRLLKCFDVGMRKDLILGDVEKKKRMEKVKQNRLKSHKFSSPKSPEDSSVTSFSNPATPVNPDLTSNPSTPLMNPGTPGPPLTPNPSNPGTPGPFTIAEGLLNIPLDKGIPSDITNLLSIAKSLRTSFILDPSTASTSDAITTRRLTEEEELMLNGLLQIYDLSFTVDLEPLVHIKQLDPTLNQLVNQSSITVLRIIKFAKRLEEFLKLPQECQIGMLKGTWIHILLLRSVSCYDSDRDIWVTPRGQIPTEILKNATGYVQLHNDHVSYCKSIKAMIHDDIAIVIILLVIVLFSPEGPHVTFRELVSNIQDKYLILLKHYLESKYSYLGASDMFPQLMQKMKELKELAEVHGKYLLDVNPREIEPIMLEILDLK